MKYHWRTLILPLALSALAASAATHDLYVCASINGASRVMGSRNGDKEGIFKRDADGEFKHIGANLPLLVALAVDPRNESRIFAAGLSGVMRSNDGGDTWRILTGWDETEPKSLAFDSRSPDVLYASLPDGVIVSKDTGQHWSRIEKGLPDRGKYSQCIQTDRTRGGRVFAGCEKGIFLTENGGQSWRQVFKATDTINDIEQSPHDPQHWIAVSQSAGALESRDGGATWRRISAVPSEHALYNVSFDSRNRGRIAIASWTYGLLTSDDDGKTWTERNAGLPEQHRVWRTAIDPDDGRLYAAIYDGALFASDDFGGTWRSVGLEGSIIRDFNFVPQSR